MHLVELVRLSFSDHKRFFRIVDTEPPSHVLSYVGLLFVWYAVFATPYFILQRFVFGLSFIPMEDYLALLPVSFALVFVFWVFMLFMWSAIVHAFVSMWGGQGRFLSTLRCVAYGITPLFILAPLFFYGLLVSNVFAVLIALLYVYAMYVVIHGLSLVHKVSFAVALTAYAIPFVGVSVWALFTLWRYGVLGV